MTNYKTYKGLYSPQNPTKYKGDPTNIIFRSLWEKKVMYYLDTNTNVIEWQSEEIAVPYRSPIDNRLHRYFPDFIAKVRKPDGNIITMMIEVKPYQQTRKPETKKRKTRKYLTEVMTWAVNDAKWKSAREFCNQKGWEFRILTEKELGITYK
jgi:hypothetical protein